MESIRESTGSFATPMATTQKQPSDRNVTTRPQARSTLFPINHEQDLDDDDHEVSYEHIHGNDHEHDDENRSIKSLHSSDNTSRSGSSSWMHNEKLMDDNSAAARKAMHLVSGLLGTTADVLQSSLAAMFNGVPVNKALSYNTTMAQAKR